MSEWLRVGREERRLESTFCSVCRGVAKNCSLLICPYYRETIKEALKNVRNAGIVFGPSPPAILVGEWGYPRVYVGTGLLLSPDIDPQLVESPSWWIFASLDELLQMRLSLLLGRVRVNVRPSRSREVEAIQESSISQRPVDMEVKISSQRIRYVPGFGVRHAPHGPSGLAENIRIVDNPVISRQVDRVINDPYISAQESAERLMSSGIDEYYISRLLSAGLLGKRIDRRLVPTEWSITATDDILSQPLVKRVKKYRVINEFRLHRYSALFNTAFVILTPTPWMYELLEGWVKAGEVYSDFELIWGRTEYAQNTGGAYYAVRLPILRHLDRAREQAGAIVFFEVDVDWIPLGVWRFREIVRAALEQRPQKLKSLPEALEMLKGHLKLGVNKYLRKSRVIPQILTQSKLQRP